MVGRLTAPETAGRARVIPPTQKNPAYFAFARPVNDERNGPGCDVLPADFRYDDTARFVTGSVHKVS